MTTRVPPFKKKCSREVIVLKKSLSTRSLHSTLNLKINHCVLFLQIFAPFFPFCIRTCCCSCTNVQKTGHSSSSFFPPSFQPNVNSDSSLKERRKRKLFLFQASVLKVSWQNGLNVNMTSSFTYNMSFVKQVHTLATFHGVF